MYIYDFEYDGLILSDLGYMVCSFDSKGLQILSKGSNISFSTVPIHNGEKNDLITSEYTECLEATFQICKKNCHTNDFEISDNDYRKLVSWLNRKRFHKFKILKSKNKENHPDIYLEASFNISQIIIDNKLYGLELNMITNRPFAVHEPIPINFSIIEQNGTKDIYDVSDEEGYIYPYMEITLQQSGNFNIYNSIENRNTYIANCMSGEKITLNYPLIQSSLGTHKIQNDFNWKFFRLCSTYCNKKNTLTVSLPCEIKMTYSPIVKISI